MGIFNTDLDNTQDRANARSFLLAPLGKYSSGKYRISIVRLENLILTMGEFDTSLYSFLIGTIGEFDTIGVFDTEVKFNYEPLEFLTGMYN